MSICAQLIITCLSVHLINVKHIALINEMCCIHQHVLLELSGSFALYLNTSKMECVHESQLLGDDTVF